MSWIQHGLYAAAIVAGLWFASRRGILGLLEVYVFLVPWFGLQANPGVTINADRFIALLLTAALAARRGLSFFLGFGAFLAFIVLNTVAQSIDLPATVRDFPPLKGQWRWAFQLVMWTLYVAPAAGIAAMTGVEEIRRLLRALFWSCTMLAALGIVQVTVYYATGVDVMPLSLFTGGEEVRSAVFETQRQGAVVRASALGGEPKHLAYSLVASLSVWSADAVFGAGILSSAARIRRVAVLLQVIALFLTLSTQGLVLIAANVALVITAGWYLRSASKRQVAFVVSVVAFAAVLLTIPDLFDLIRVRTVDRFAQDGFFEDWNLAIMAWLADDAWALPLGVGLGNVHLYAASYIPQDFLYYMGGNVFVAKSGGLRLVSEAGLIGTTLFLIMAFRPVLALLKRARQGSNFAAAIAVLTTLGTVDFMVTADGPVYVFIFIGCACAAARALRPAPTDRFALRRQLQGTGV